MIDMGKEPRIMGQTMPPDPDSTDMGNIYPNVHMVYDLNPDVILPWPKNQLTPCKHVGKSVLEVMADMIDKKTRYELEQTKVNVNPGQWINVGYWDNGSGTIIAYYQIGFVKKGQTAQDPMDGFRPVPPYPLQQPTTPTTPFWGHGPF